MNLVTIVTAFGLSLSFVNNSKNQQIQTINYKQKINWRKSI